MLSEIERIRMLNHIPRNARYTIIYFANSMSFFKLLFIKEYLKFGEREISFIPIITAAAGLFIVLVAVPRLSRSKGSVNYRMP